MTSDTYTPLAMFIGPNEIAAGARDRLPVLNPATGQTLGDLPTATAQDLDAALGHAAAAFEPWRRTSAFDRSAILRRAADLIRERAPRIARVLTLEEGKPLGEALAEVANAAAVIDWYAEEGRRAYGRVIPSRDPATRHLVVMEPVGPVVAFTPWNFPALTPARKIGGALAAGCVLILKASEETPGTAVELVRAFRDAGLPAGVLNLVFGDPPSVSAHLLSSPIPRKLSFTGSVPVGKQLMRQAADGLLRTTLELGGHSPVIVCDDVDIAAVAEIAVAGKFRNAGQVCIAPTRFYVQDGVIDQFVDRFVSLAAKLRLGDGLAEETQMGPLASARRLDAMDALVKDAQGRGATIRTGGARRGNAGYFYEPTVVTEIADDSRLMTEEPFGPIAPIVPFADIDEVLARANGLPYGLAAYAFTTSAARVGVLGAGLKAGMVGINTFAVSNPETPFGGVKHSGQGQEGGIEGLGAYLDVKFIAQA
jgi:succinate-semialdehyde dehydrogenase/glutarate-semialdehyde dehydrogenase